MSNPCILPADFPSQIRRPARCESAKARSQGKQAVPEGHVPGRVQTSGNDGKTLHLLCDDPSTALRFTLHHDKGQDCRARALLPTNTGQNAIGISDVYPARCHLSVLECGRFLLWRVQCGRSMSARVLLSAGFVFHALIGNFCMMMPMAYAMETETHNDHEATMMTPVTQMSSVHCADCAITKLSAEHPSPATPSCTGHCLAQAKNAAVSSAPLSAPHMQAPAAIPVTVAWTPPSRFHTILALKPPNTVSTKTIVLRL